MDSDFAADLDKRRSLTGYVFTVSGCAVNWNATLQGVVAQSTTEAEYMAIDEACKESVWLKGLFADLCGDDTCINLFYDSQSAIYLTKDQMFHVRTKHIDVKYHYVRAHRMLAPHLSEHSNISLLEEQGCEWSSQI